MTSPTQISVKQLSRLIGLPNAPCIVDLRLDEDFALDPRLIPGSRRRCHTDVSQWMLGYSAQRVVVVCHQGKKLSQGVAALMRHEGIEAETLEAGFEAWADAGQPAVDAEKMPRRDSRGRTIWVTRYRPKIDRTACPWLIRRFIDPEAVFLYVSPSEVERVGDIFGAQPFDVEGVFWSHRGDGCSFDTILNEFGLSFAPLETMATIIRGADTSRPDLAPEAAGLLAVSLGLSRMFSDDLEQLSASMTIYDALYRWCRDAMEETHGWPPKHGTQVAQ